MPLHGRTSPISVVIAGLFVLLLASMGGCRNSAQVGRSAVDAADDGGQLPDAPADISLPPADMSNADTGASDDAGDMDSVEPDASVDSGVLDDCPKPWGLALAEGKRMRVVRFSFAELPPTRCDALRAGGSLPATSLDLTVVDELVVVVGTEQIVAIDSTNDTVRWNLPSNAGVSVHAFTVDGEPPWLGYADFEGPGATLRIVGIRSDGEREMEWTLPALARTLGAQFVTSYPEAGRALVVRSDGRAFVFSPFSGLATSEAIFVDRMQLGHVGAGSPPSIAGETSGGNVIQGLVEDRGTTNFFIPGCRAEGVAPNPADANGVLVICRSGSRASLLTYDRPTRTLNTLMEAGPGEPDVRFAGVAIAF